jgi:zinc-ribbon domain/SPOR domain
MGTIRCSECGQPLAKGASFCRACGARHTTSTAGPDVGDSPTAVRGVEAPRSQVGTIVSIVAVLAIGAGAAVAILLAAGGGSSTTTVIHRETSDGSIGGGRYVQAGSFQTASHADAERRRLAAHGIEVEVVSSDEAAELYPGFQVLLGGPFGSQSAEAGMLRRLHRNGVPSAFARDITPAPNGVKPEAAAGRWRGDLERTSSEHPNLNGLLPAILTVATSGTSGSLELPTLRCHVGLSLESTGRHTFSYGMKPACVGAGPLVVRPSGGELMLTVRSPETDSFALGALSLG